MRASTWASEQASATSLALFLSLSILLSHRRICVRTSRRLSYNGVSRHFCRLYLKSKSSHLNKRIELSNDSLSSFSAVSVSPRIYSSSRRSSRDVLTRYVRRSLYTHARHFRSSFSGAGPHNRRYEKSSDKFRRRSICYSLRKGSCWTERHISPDAETRNLREWKARSFPSMYVYFGSNENKTTHCRNNKSYDAGLKSH